MDEKDQKSLAPLLSLVWQSCDINKDKCELYSTALKDSSSSENRG